MSILNLKSLCVVIRQCKRSDPGTEEGSFATESRTAIYMTVRDFAASRRVNPVNPGGVAARRA
jgi:hypothetical protein